MSTDPQSRSLSELTKELTEQTSRLAQKEIELAKAELSAKGKQAGIRPRGLGGAGVMGVAALIVTGVLFAVAGVLALMGKAKVKQASPPVPQQTVETVREDVQEAKSR